ncbi:hypothetical protein VC83_03954 [Pseudogymnoascus destructans]|uniref:N-acetyltransferase domain-containing protein n=1 Tax=Pseudogymnoascus destructans TaxID=655981 RepID=A0A177AED6_9PEZI|nr:uncharacterized protein VC83_03954 [Pseudogymnoascus destructans]OAF59534.1 hypothetical protein VC83_03954 [Pseudogymnoascus destructans]
MASSFSSERLIYRGLEGTPRDKAFILSILSDRTSSENTTNYLVKPASSADVDSFMRGFREAFLGVLVCTPNPSAPQTPNIIGYVNLQHTHPHHRSCTMSIRIRPEAQGRGYGLLTPELYHRRDGAPKYLLWAATMDRPETLERARSLGHHGADYTAARFTRPDSLKLLIDAGYDVNLKSFDCGYTPLYEG